MLEQGKVVKVKDKFATVRLGRHSACGSCGKCGMTENQKHADIYIANSVDAKVGDTVEISLSDANTLVMAVVAYLIPLLLGVIAFVVGMVIGVPDWALLLLFIGGFALAFVVVSLIDIKKNHKWMATPTMTKIIIEEKGDNNE